MTADTSPTLVALVAMEISLYSQNDYEADTCDLTIDQRLVVSIIDKHRSLIDSYSRFVGSINGFMTLQ